MSSSSEPGKQKLTNERARTHAHAHTHASGVVNILSIWESFFTQIPKDCAILHPSVHNIEACEMAHGAEEGESRHGKGSHRVGEMSAPQLTQLTYNKQGPT